MAAVERRSDSIPARARAARPEAIALWASLVLFAVLLSLQRIDSFDYWWHLRTGELILDTGAVPKADPYTYTVPGARWIDIHWLFQVGLYGLQEIGGHEAVVIGQVLAVLGVLALLAPIGLCRERPVVSALALTSVLVISCMRFIARPELVSFLCLAGVLALLHRFERESDPSGGRAIYALVPLQLLWVNVHGLFAVGLAAIAITWVGEALRPLAGREGRPARVRRLGGVLVVATLVSVLNPNGLDGALYPIEQLGMMGPPQLRGGFGRHIDELLPLFGRRSETTAIHNAVILGLAAASGLAIAANARRAHLADPLLWGGFLYLAVTASRNAALFAIVAAPLFVRNANPVLDSFPRAASALRAGGAGLAIGLALLSFSVATHRFYPAMGITRELGLGVGRLIYPEAAADWIATRRPAGPLFHAMQDGGYLIWRLYPDYRVMSDGRLEVYGLEKLASLQVTSPGRFEGLDDRYAFGSVLLNHAAGSGAALLRHLHRSPEWKLVFADDVAAVFTRASAPGATGFAHVDLDAPDLFPPMPNEPDTADRGRRIARINFLTAVNRPERALALWQEALARHPDIPGREIIGARLLLRAGRAADADALLQTALDAHPRNAPLRVQASALYARIGRTTRAEQLLAEARALDPTLRAALPDDERRALEQRERRERRARRRGALGRLRGLGAEGVALAAAALLFAFTLYTARRHPSRRSAEA